MVFGLLRHSLTSQLVFNNSDILISECWRYDLGCYSTQCLNVQKGHFGLQMPISCWDSCAWGQYTSYNRCLCGSNRADIMLEISMGITCCLFLAHLTGTVSNLQQTIRRLFRGLGMHLGASLLVFLLRISQLPFFPLKLYREGNCVDRVLVTETKRSNAVRMLTQTESLMWSIVICACLLPSECDKLPEFVRNEANYFIRNSFSWFGSSSLSSISISPR